MRQRVTLRADRSIRFRDMAVFSIFPKGRRPPSWICVWTTHEEYFLVFIILQTFVGIGAVVLIIPKFQYFASYAGKCLFTPPK